MDKIQYINENINGMSANVYLAPEISDKLMKKVIRNITIDTAPESVIGIIDSSIKGNGKSGCVFTSNALYMKGVRSKKIAFLYSQIKRVEFNPMNIEKSSDSHQEKLRRRIVFHLENDRKVDITEYMARIHMEEFYEFMKGLIISRDVPVIEREQKTTSDIKTKSNHIAVKTGKAAARIVGTTVLGTVGIVAGVTEKIGDASDNEILREIAYQGKSASLNGVRKMWGKEPKVYGYEDGSNLKQDMMDAKYKAEMVREEKLIKAQIHIDAMSRSNPNEAKKMQSKLDSFILNARSTYDDFEQDQTGLDIPPESYPICYGERLGVAKQKAPSEPGVYSLSLNGQIMKCGSAVSLSKRLHEYHRLDYDKNAKKGKYDSITEENKDNVIVAFQGCPKSKMMELEGKLFRQYGKGAWARNAPRVTKDTWPLLI